MKKITWSFLLVILSISLKAQNNDLCQESEPFCANTLYSFQASIGGFAQEGPFYGCLLTQPNPSWFYFKVADPGEIVLTIYSEPENDIDYILWGPFEDPNACCESGLNADALVSCSYSSSYYEICNIPYAQKDAYYVLLITNYSNNQCKVLFTQTDGNGSTDCTIMPSMASSNSPVCEYDTLKLATEYVENAIYSWSGPNGFTSNVQNPVVSDVTAEDAGEYCCITSVSGLSDTSFTSVEINLQPTLNMGADQLICPDEPAYLSFNLLGVPPFSVTFTDQYEVHSFVCMGFDTTIAVWPEASVIYQVLSSSDLNCSGEIINGSAAVTIHNEIQIVNLETLCNEANSNYTVNFEIQGGDPATYSLSPGPGSITLSPPYIFTSEAIPQGLPFYFTISDYLDCSSKTVVGIQSCQCPVTAEIFGQGSICEGDSAVIGIYMTGTPPWEITVASVIPDAVDTVYQQITTMEPEFHYIVHPSVTTDYVIVNISDQYCSGSAIGKASITVNPIPEADFAWTNECLGSTTKFYDRSFTQKGNIIGWDWDFGDGAGTSPSKNPQYIYSYPGNYMVDLVVTTNHSCTDTVSQRITVFPEVSIDIPDDTAIAYGSTAFLTANVSEGSGSYGFSWSPSQLVVHPDQLQTETVGLTESVSFTLTVTDLVTACTAVAGRMVIVTGGKLTAFATAEPSVICQGSVAQLNAVVSGGTGNYYYHWTSEPPGFESLDPSLTVNPQSRTRFYLETSDGISTVFSEVIVEVLSNPEVEAGNSLDILYGTCTSLDGVVTGGQSPYSYKWTPPEFLLDPESEDPTTLPLTSSVLFNLQVTDNLGCSGSDEVLVDVKGIALEAFVSVFPDEPVCGGDSVLITVIASGGSGNYSFIWKDPDGATLSEVPSLFVMPQQSTIFWAEVSDGFTTAMVPAYVEVIPPPDVNMLPDGYSGPEKDTVTVCMYDDIIIHAGPPFYSYLWYNGSMDPYLELQTCGVGFDAQKIWLQVTDDLSGCTLTDSIYIEFDFSECVGVGGIPGQKMISIYPNPVAEILFIESKSLKSPLKMRLMNFTGQVVMPEVIICPGNSISLSQVNLTILPPGVYLLEIISDGYLHIEKIIVN
jgi:PKD repeat protein